MLMRRQHLQKAALQGQLKCRDFGKILEEEQLTPDAQMKSKAKEECNHDNKDFRGSTGTTWKWTCKDCGRGVTVAKLPEGNQRGRPRRPAVPIRHCLHRQAAAHLEIRHCNDCMEASCSLEPTSPRLLMVYRVEVAWAKNLMGQHRPGRLKDQNLVFYVNYARRRKTEAEKTTSAATSRRMEWRGHRRMR